MGKESRSGLREEIPSPKEMRREVILYLLYRYGNLRTKEIAKVLGQNPRTVRRSLKKMEESGKVKSDRLGRGYVWSPANEEQDRLIYF